MPAKQGRIKVEVKPHAAAGTTRKNLEDAFAVGSEMLWFKVSHSQRVSRPPGKLVDVILREKMAKRVDKWPSK